MSNGQGIPLLQMFHRCALSGDALCAAQSCQICHAAIHQAARSVELEVSFPVTPSVPVMAELKEAICHAYGRGGGDLLPAARDAAGTGRCGTEEEFPSRKRLRGGGSATL